MQSQIKNTTHYRLKSDVVTLYDNYKKSCYKIWLKSNPVYSVNCANCQNKFAKF